LPGRMTDDNEEASYRRESRRDTHKENGPRQYGGRCF